VQGHYFDNGDWQGRSVNFTGPNYLRTDPNIAYDWGNGQPHPSIGADQFSVRWSGYFVANETGPHTFATDTDDGFHFAIDTNIDGVLEEIGLNNLNVGQGYGQPEVATTIVNLTSGQRYRFIMEMDEGDGGAAAFFKYKTDSMGGLIDVPATMLQKPDQPTTVGVLSAAPAAGGIKVTWTDTSVDEVGYIIERAADANNDNNPDAPFAQVAKTTTYSTVLEYTDTVGLTGGTKYLYRLRAYNISGESPNSNTASATTFSGSLSVVGTPNITGNTNLTTEGNLGWRHWGLGGSATASNRNGVPGVTYNDNAIVLEGESGVFSSGFSVINLAGASGGKALQASTGNTNGIGNAVVTYTFNVINPGNYKLFVRRQVAGGGDNSFFRPAALDIAADPNVVGGTQWDNRETPLNNILLWTASDGVTPNVADYGAYTANNPITYNNVTA
jgi:hypothetical protein